MTGTDALSCDILDGLDSVELDSFIFPALEASNQALLGIIRDLPNRIGLFIIQLGGGIK